jgi:hypothetical protein
VDGGRAAMARLSAVKLRLWSLPFLATCAGACSSGGLKGGTDGGPHKIQPCSSLSFANPESWPAGNTPTGMAAADLNSDGVADVVVANGGDTVLTLLLSNDGGFLGPVSLDGGTNPRAIAIGDVNGDGNADLVVTELGSFQLGVYLGHGDGTFAAPRMSVESALYGVVLGDLDGDGNPDAVLVDTPGNKVGVRLNGDGGTFIYAGDYAPGVGPTAAALADFNGDGLLDIVVVGDFGGSVSILFGQADGGFSSPVGFATSLANGSTGVAVADFDQNGSPDVAVCNTGPEAASPTGDVDVFLNEGDGGLRLAFHYDTGVGPSGIVAADFDSNGWPDLAVSNQVDGTVTVLRNQADGGEFDPPKTFLAPALPTAITAGDFNADQRPDLSVAGGASGAAGTVAVLLNTCAL